MLTAHKNRRAISIIILEDKKDNNACIILVTNCNKIQKEKEEEKQITKNEKT